MYQSYGTYIGSYVDVYRYRFILFQFSALKSLVCLVERDCDITIGDNAGNLPIHCAAAHNHLNCLRFLVKQGTSKEASQGDGKTPAHVVWCVCVCLCV